MKKSKRTLTPKLRFPEFREQWDEVQLSQLANSISDRVGTMSCIPYTVTSGLGLVSQEEKLGRTIAGNSLRNYIRLQKDDFAYNKSATKAYPEGYIARYLDEAKAAVPNSIFTCFRVDSEKVEPAYLDFLFAGNLHGRWLRKFLSIGARAHGSLNVSDDDLMALPVPLPSPPEQQKIAECLSSLDGLIVAEGRKLAALRDHKRGLMQQLFPQTGQTRPRLRFPEFRTRIDWLEGQCSDIAHVWQGYGFPDRYQGQCTGKYPFYKVSDISAAVEHGGQLIEEAQNYIDETVLKKLKAKPVPAGTIVFAKIGEGIRKDRRALTTRPAVIDNNVAGVKAITGKVTDDYLFYLWTTISLIDFAGGVVPAVSKTAIESIPVSYPEEKDEQVKIASCLAALDTRITAQTARIETLKQHKRGLMQHLFPAPEEQ